MDALSLPEKCEPWKLRVSRETLKIIRASQKVVTINWWVVVFWVTTEKVRIHPTPNKFTLLN